MIGTKRYLMANRTFHRCAN